MSWFRRAPDDRDLEAEINFHLEQEAQLRAERGESLDQARNGARRAFGSVTLAKENTRAVWVWTALEQLLQDVRLGCRILTTSPALSATAVMLIALVIGGNTTVFSMANGFLTKPAQGVTASGLVTLGWTDGRGLAHPFNSYLVYERFREDSRTLDRLLGIDADQQTLNHEGGSYAVRTGMVTPNYFETLGVGFARGRGFAADEPAAVISHRAWHNYFQGDERVVGKAVTVNSLPVTIVGVTAPGFRGATIPESADLWIPLGRWPGSAAMIGRLAPGASIEQARAELSALWARLQNAHPELEQQSKFVLVPYSINAGTGTLIDHQSSLFLAIFSIVTAMTLLIVCANVANLLMARAVIRQRELALRQSLGASRTRIVRALLAEGLALSVVSWGAACLAAWMVTRAISGYLVPGSPGIFMPDFTPDWTVLGYALVLAMFCAIACTMAPAFRAWRQPLLPPLKAGDQAVIQGQSTLSRCMVVVQVGFSVLLVTCAGLAYRSLFLIASFDSGFDTRNLLLVTVNTAGSATSAEANAALLETVRSRLSAVGGVLRVSYVSKPPRENWGRADVRLPGSLEGAIRAETDYVGPDYLAALGVSLVAGRDPAHDAGPRPMPAAMISRGLAEQLWPGRSPLGRTVVVGRRDARQEVEVAGVTPDRYFSGFRRELPAFVFMSARHEPAPPGEATLYVRYVGSLDTVGPAVGRALQQVDPRTAIAFMRTWDTQIDYATWPVRVLTTLLTLFAGGSLFIAAIGQYAVVSFDMRRRVRELGLRIALGASSKQVLAGVLREGFVLTAIGLLIGFALSLAVGRILGRALYGITATDPMTYFGVFVLLSAASLLACYVPARRAARINPMAALRVE